MEQVIDGYEGLAFTQQELIAAIRETYASLIDFVTSRAFRTVYRELRELPAGKRPDFVESVLLDRDELAKRGVRQPSDVLIQTSAFGDRRPTLFAVKKFLPEKFHGVWENVNLTFNNEYDDAILPRDPETSWRAPLPVDLQNALIRAGVDLSAVPESMGIWYDRAFSSPMPPPGPVDVVQTRSGSMASVYRSA